MNTQECIIGRRSIRKYSSKELTKEQVDTLLKAAMYAPSAGNAQPWDFIVVQDQATRNRIAAIHPYGGMAAEAPLSIIVCGNEQAEKFPGFWPQDCAAAIQNILLAAYDMGLGTVWTGIYPVKERVANFVKEFQLPAHIIPMANIVVGHPDMPSKIPNRVDMAKVHYEKF